MENASLRELLTLISATSLFIGILIDKRDQKAQDALSGSPPEGERLREAVARAKFHLQRQSVRGAVGLMLKIVGGGTLFIALILYFVAA